MTQKATQYPSCSLGRRLAAMLYDSFLLFAVIFMAAWLLLIIFGQEVAATPNPLINIYYIAVAFLFFGWFWTHGGQTLGMRVWRVQVTDERGEPISWQQAAIRFAVSILSWICVAMGFLWAIFDKENRGWHDLASKTRLVVLPKK
ncbi:MAG: RDD family protein [Gammaproteobacteria bacterium]|nr:RDD family protein [Gammaproteobacteria bacterium]MCW8887710.1 RDD family protein [Gammaproteobacteria bacterium]